MAILLTGAVGFIGRNFAASHQLLGDGQTLWETDCTVPLNKSEHYVKADLTDVNEVVELFRHTEPKTVIHLAGATSVGGQSDSNITILKNLFAAARQTGPCLPHFILAGSAAEYGDVKEPATEDAPLNPREPYAASKVACFGLAQKFAEDYGAAVTVLRFVNVYGAGQTNRVIPLIMNAAFHGAPIVLHGNGKPIRQFVAVTDVCRAIRLVVRRAPHGVLNIGSTEEISMRQLADIIVTAVHDYQLRSGVIPYPALYDLQPSGGGAMRVAVDSSKARTVLGWEPTVKFYYGVRRAVHYWAEEQKRENRKNEAA